MNVTWLVKFPVRGFMISTFLMENLLAGHMHIYVHMYICICFTVTLKSVQGLLFDQFPGSSDMVPSSPRIEPIGSFMKIMSSKLLELFF